MPSDDADDAVLVVGATGVLRPAVGALSGRGVPVLALARPGPRLETLVAGDPLVTAVPADFHDLAALDRALPARYAGALLYCPTASAEAVKLVAAPATGRVVHLLTSAAADLARTGASLDLAELPTVAVRLLLGWHPDRRWHTPDEISAAALAAWDDGRDRILGTVRPWNERPA